MTDRRPRRVVIVGGGLAGAVLALWCQHHGLDVRVLERSRRAKTTLCGEGIRAATLHRLRPVFDAGAHVDSTFQGARWTFGPMDVHAHAPCHTMARETWIPAMAEASQDLGATWEFGSSVRDPEALLDESDVVVGCDGPGSRVRKAMNAPPLRTRTGIQVRLETDATTPWLRFVTDKRFGQEYAWWFPRRDFHNVGLLAEQDGKDWDRLAAFQDHLGLEGSVRAKEAFPISFGGRHFARPDGRMALLGDAAGIANAATKGGMAAILHAAPLLADHIARGDVAGFQKTMREHPLTHPASERALGTIRRWTDQDLQRMLGRMPAVHLGGPRPTSPRAAVPTLLRRPWLLRHAPTFLQAARAGFHHSW